MAIKKSAAKPKAVAKKAPDKETASHMTKAVRPASARKQAADRQMVQAQAAEEREAAGVDTAPGLYPRATQPVLLNEPKAIGNVTPEGVRKDADADNSTDPVEDKGEAVFGKDSHPTAGAEASQAQVVSDPKVAKASEHHDPAVSVAGIRTKEAMPEGPKKAMFEADYRVQELKTQVDAARRAVQTGSERTDLSRLEAELLQARRDAEKEHRTYEASQGGHTTATARDKDKTPTPKNPKAKTTEIEAPLSEDEKDAKVKAEAKAEAGKGSTALTTG